MTKRTLAKTGTAWASALFAALLMCLAWPGDAEAQRRRHAPGVPKAHKAQVSTLPPGTTHAMKPLESLGMEKTATNRVTKALARQMAQVPEVTLAPLAHVQKFLKSRDGAPYAQCEGDLSCIYKLGSLVGAPLMVTGDLSGLARGYVLFLRLTSPDRQEVLRTVSVVHDGEAAKEAAVLKEAAYRLLAPEKFQGTVTFTIDVPGAQVYLNGQLLGKSPIPARQVQAGTHALRVTHPSYHDSLRFIDVAFEESTTIKVSLTMYPIIAEELHAKDRPRRAVESAAPGGQITLRPLPWYKQWWFVTVVGTALLAATVTTVALARPRHLDRDGSVTLEKPLVSPSPFLVRFGR